MAEDNKIAGEDASAAPSVQTGGTAWGKKLKEPLWTKDFILISLINFFIFSGFQMFPSALPLYVKTLGASDVVLGWLTGAVTLSTLIVRPFAGVFMDKFGRKGAFITGLVVMLVSTAALYFFPIVGIILAIRFINGLGWGVTGTACSTVASDCIPKSRFGEGMGYFSLSVNMAIAIAPAVALSISPPAMIWTATALTGVALALAFAVRYQAPPKPAPSAGRVALYERASIVPSAIIFMVTSAYGATLTFIAIYAKTRGIGNIGLFFTVFAVVMLLTRPYLGILVDRRGHNTVILPGLIILMLSLLLLSQATSLPVFLISAALYAIGQGSVHTSTQTLAVMNAPKHRIGAANATFFTGFDGGIGFGSIIAGVLVGWAGYSGMFMSLMVFPAIGILLYLVDRRKKKKA